MNKQHIRLLLLGTTAALLLPLVGADSLTPDVLGNPTKLDAVKNQPTGPRHDHPEGQYVFIPPSGGKPITFTAADDQPRNAGGRFSVEWRCPEVAGASGDGEATVNGAQCPMFVIDNEDLVGNPKLMVDPYNPDVQVIHELHGGRGVRVPSNDATGGAPIPGNPVTGSSDEPNKRARWNALHQPHTAFQTANGGSLWEDNRYYAHESMKSNGSVDRVVYGIDNGIAVDVRGEVVVAAGYAYKEPNEGEGNWEYVVSLYAQPRALKKFDWNSDLRILHNTHDPQDEENRHVFPKNKIENLYVVYDKKTDKNIVLWLETKMPDTRRGFPNGGPDFAPKTWVMIHVNDPANGNSWEPIDGSMYVGPCIALGQPIALHGQVYFPCKPGEGYNYPNATAGRWQIHALDIESMATRHVSSTPIQTFVSLNEQANAILVDMADTGRTALITSEADPAGQADPTIKVTHGVYGAAWDDPVDIGSNMRLLPRESTRDLIRARVTAASYLEDSGNMFFTYQERYYGRPDGEGDQFDPDPRRPGESAQSQAAKVRSVDKTVGVVHPYSGRFVGKFDTLQFGQGMFQHKADPIYQGGLCTNTDECDPPGNDESIFEDMHDDIITWIHPETKKERVFSVFSDMGVARWGEMIEVFALPFPPLPPIAPTAIPLLAPAQNAAANAAAAGVLSALMLLRLLSSKKKVYAAAPTL